jgi:Protein of unknown function (DUF3309)
VSTFAQTPIEKIHNVSCSWTGSSRASTSKETIMLGTILIVILILALIGVLPRWSHSKQWGYVPSGGLGLVLLIVIILLVLGRI